MLDRDVLPLAPLDSIAGNDRLAVGFRLDADEAQWLSIPDPVLEIMAAIPRVYCGRLPVVAHRATATDEIDRFLGLAGHHLPGRVITYAHQAALAELLRELARQGYRIIGNHIPSVELGDIHLNARSLLMALNNKSTLSALVPAAHRFAREAVSLARFLNSFFDSPVVVKAITSHPTGAGLANRICRSQESYEEAKRHFLACRDSLDGLLVEEFGEMADTWCAQVLIGAQEVRYLGAARQIIDAHGHWQGNIVGGVPDVPGTVQELALAIAQAGQLRGYRGYAGFDMGVDQQGRLMVFDLNFRANGSLAQLQFDRHLRREPGILSRNCRVSRQGAFRDFSRILQPWVASGAFFPVACLDGELHGSGVSIVAGYIQGDGVQALDAIEAEINKAAEYANALANVFR